MRKWEGLVEAAHLSTLTALVVIVAVDPLARMRSAPDWCGWLIGQQRLDGVMSRVAPPLFLSAAAAAAGATLIEVGRRRSRPATGRGTALGCIAATIAVTLTVNEPMNARIREWRSEDAPPEGWQMVRARWDQGHRLRRALIAVGAVATVWGSVGPRPGGPVAR